MTHEIIMPALGMTQDFGLIVTWHKKPGDAVSSDEVLFEVETDKSTVEVPAGKSGFIGSILAAEGTEVPVGNVIATISSENIQSSSSDSNVSNKAPSIDLSKEPKPKNEEIETAETKNSKFVQLPKSQLNSNHPILASPKTRRLALEEGLDLSLLVKAGVPQPYHVRNLEMLRDISKKESENQLSTIETACRITAELDYTPMKEFLDRIADETDQKFDEVKIYSLFAAACLRIDERQQIIVQVNDSKCRQFFINPDLLSIGEIKNIEKNDSNPITLLIRDLTDSIITGVMLGGEQQPVLTLLKQNDNLQIILEYYSNQLTSESALNLITGFSKRLETPLPYLLKI